jgi:hypothetical protein
MKAVERSLKDDQSDHASLKGLDGVIDSGAQYI